jgi:hypothetical protein
MKYCITPEFESIIGESRLESLNSHPSTVYGLDSEFKISYLNPAWFKFSEENGGEVFTNDEWSLGRNIFDCIPDVLELYYRKLFDSTFEEVESPGISIQSEYECSSPTLYRRFSMHIYSIGVSGFVVVHSLVVEEPHKIPSIEGGLVFDEDEYIDDNKLVHQCVNCRRIKNQRYEGRWDWLPKLIEDPHPNTSHGLCYPCMRHYYPSKISTKDKRMDV